MEYLPKSALVNFEENTLDIIRKKYGFDKTERVNEAIDILDTWIQKQEHFVVKKFCRRYLEATIIMCKGSLEKAKWRIDKMCTYRTLLPQFFVESNIRGEFKQVLDYATFGLLPTQTKDCLRVGVVKIIRNRFTPDLCLHAMSLFIVGAEYIKVNDYVDGFTVIIDYREADIVDILKNINLVDLRNGMSILIDGIGARIAGLHIFTDSSAVEMLVTVFKQAISAKIGERVFVYKNIEDLYELVPKHMLPAEYGGKEKSLLELKDDFLNELDSKGATEYRKYNNSAGTNETLRQKHVFKDQYLGIPGSFRTLTVD